MPYKPLKPCAYPICPNLTRDYYCPDHIHLAQAEHKEMDKNRPTAHQRGYDTTWEKIRNYVLATEPLCRRCYAIGQAKPANLVHHQDHNPRNNENGNLEPMCESCHDLEHSKRKGNVA